MSSESVISLLGASKSFRVYKRPIDRFLQCFSKGKKHYDEFTAVHPIYLEIKKGEAIGIIGVNGSGKSTLLQLICNIYKPTSGSIQTEGRIAALLELGAGFNPEFTGIENVYLNASLYGLSKAEINRELENIKKFADIGDFFYKPIKTYSSGMVVRLAFAVIAHIDAKVLVIDEALAVGDAIFVQKCMQFIRSFKTRGTLIFVSHDISSVINLCDRALWLNQGAIMAIGTPKEVAEKYLQFSLEKLLDNNNAVKYETLPTASASNLESNGTQNYSHSRLNAKKELSGWKTGCAEIFDISLTPLLDSKKNILEGGEKVRLAIYAKAHKRISGAIIGFLWRDRLGQDLFGENISSTSSLSHIVIEEGESIICEFDFTIPHLPNGEYAIACAIAEGSLEKNVQHHWIHNAFIVKVFSQKARWGLVGIQCDSIQINKL